MTTVVAATLLLGPGLVLRWRSRRCSGLWLAAIPIPGMLLLSSLGLAVWLISGSRDPRLFARRTVIGIVVSVAFLAVGGARESPARGRLHAGQVRALLVAATTFVIALGRTLWSLGPDGELYAGTISRTLEVGDRPDSRISYHVAWVLANGLDPFTGKGAQLFAPYAFADRGPVPGAAATPLMLVRGTSPVAGFSPGRCSASRASWCIRSS